MQKLILLLLSFYLLLGLGLAFLGEHASKLDFYRLQRDKLSSRNEKLTLFAEKGPKIVAKPGSKKYQCVSCSYVFDEAVGFKKRFLPGTDCCTHETDLALLMCFAGTIFATLPVFMCPVCGAAKDQFREVKEEGK